MPDARRCTPAESLREYGRGIAGGLLFSLPLLYTMEIWWAGLSARPLHLVGCVVAAFVLLLGYNRHAGLRPDSGWAEVAIDSIEEMGIGLLLAAAVLYLTGRVTGDMPLNEVVGKIVVEAMAVAIGVSVGTAQLGADDANGDANGGPGDEEAAAGFTGQLVIACCGAMFVALNVAPTEEIVVIATGTSPARLLVLALSSMALGGAILYFAGFTGAQRLAASRTHMGVAMGTVVTYAVALGVSALVLWFFGRFDGQALATIVAQCVVLSLAATLGASAGRLLLQPQR
jgi:putative integral membrane protein (TIGR02587 family)